MEPSTPTTHMRPCMCKAGDCNSPAISFITKQAEVCLLPRCVRRKQPSCLSCFKALRPLLLPATSRRLLTCWPPCGAASSWWAMYLSSAEAWRNYRQEGILASLGPLTPFKKVACRQCQLHPLHEASSMLVPPISADQCNGIAHVNTLQLRADVCSTRHCIVLSTVACQQFSQCLTMVYMNSHQCDVSTESGGKVSGAD